MSQGTVISVRYSATTVARKAILPRSVRWSVNEEDILPQSKPVSHKKKWVSTNDKSTSDVEELQLFTVGVKSSTPQTVDLSINGEEPTLELDTELRYLRVYSKVNYPQCHMLVFWASCRLTSSTVNSQSLYPLLLQATDPVCLEDFLAMNAHTRTVVPLPLCDRNQARCKVATYTKDIRQLTIIILIL